jgi:hypothetical protein
MSRHLDPERATYYAYDLADPEERLETARHLGECPACESEVRRLTEERSKVLEAVARRECPPDLAARIRARLAERPVAKATRPGWLRSVGLMVGSLAAAACAILALVLVLAYPGTSSPTLVRGSVTLEDGRELTAPATLPAAQPWSLKAIRGEAIFQAPESETLLVRVPAGRIEGRGGRFSIRGTKEVKGEIEMNTFASEIIVAVLAGTAVFSSPAGRSVSLSTGDSVRTSASEEASLVQETANPEYVAWAKFKVGTSVSYQVTERASVPGAVPRTESWQEKHTLVELKSDEAVVEVAKGQDVRKRHIPARIEKEEGNLKVLQEGDEEIDVAGQKLKCHFQVVDMNQVKIGAQQGYTTWKTWKSSEVPGGLARKHVGLDVSPRLQIEVERWEKK